MVTETPITIATKSVTEEILEHAADVQSIEAQPRTPPDSDLVDQIIGALHKDCC